jgi:sodium-dependent dicarboxylate transporter 2/3/5
VRRFGRTGLTIQMPRRLGLLAGLALFAAIFAAPSPQGMPDAARLAAAVSTLMAVWWLTEAVPVAVTALVPVVAMPLLGIVPAADITAPYASKTNFLFLGGLIIATALERWHLHRRMALHIIRIFGHTLSGLVLGFMAATAAISVWISNAATTMMMLPIAMAVTGHFRERDHATAASLGPVLLLAVAYSATIGGMGTIVGTPPNAVFVGMLAQLFPEAPKVGFFQWMMVGIPLVVVMVPLVWLYLVHGASDLGRRHVRVDPHLIDDQLRALGSITVPERRVLVVFVTTALLWMFRRPLDLGVFVLPGWASWMPAPAMCDDSTVAIGMALVLFACPAGDDDGSRLLDWESAVRLPWGVIVLLGGGFALAHAIRVSGLAEWIGALMGWVGAAPALASIFTIALVISFLTEITTNTAITTIMMPILAASAVAGGCDPLLLMLPCTMAASLCFMMPSGTAPNAIVFSGGELTVAYMARTGFLLNLGAVILVTLTMYVVAIPAFAISLDAAPVWSLH